MSNLLWSDLVGFSQSLCVKQGCDDAGNEEDKDDGKDKDGW